MMRRAAFPVSVLLALLLVGAAYANHFHNGFHFDDAHTVVDNPFIRSLAFVPRFFTDSRTFSVLPLNQGYRPIVSTTLAIDYRLGGGLVPLWFHVSTFVAFLALLGATFLLFRALLDRSPRPSPANRWLALWGTTLFGVHPAGAETVNYVVQRADLYVALGWAAALAMFVAGGRWRRSGLYLVPFTLAGLSKPTALAFPLLVALYLVVFERPRKRDLLVACLPSLLVTVALALLHARMTPPTYTTGALDPLGYRITQPLVALHFVRMFLWPSQLSADTDWTTLPPTDHRVWMGGAFLALLVGVAVWACRRPGSRAAGFGLGWFVIGMLPTSLTPLAEVTNDHRMFAPFMGLALVAAWAVGALRERLDVGAGGDPVRGPEDPPGATGEPPPAARDPLAGPGDPRASTRRITALALAALVILGGGAWGTHVRNRAWLSEETLWADTVQKSPRNGRAWMNHGLGFAARGQYPEALRCFLVAQPLVPRYSYLFVNLGVVHGAMGHFQEAEACFKEGLKCDTSRATACLFYARWLEGRGRSGEAIATLEEGLRRVPQDPACETLLLELLHKHGRWADLDRLVARIPSSDPCYPQARTHADQVAAERRALLERAVARAQQDPSRDSLADLSHAYFRAARYEECITAARECLVRYPRSAVAYNNICAADLELRRWDDAIEAARQACALDPTLEIARNNLRYAEQMKAGASPR